MHLRPIEPADHPWVLEVNERHVDLLSPLDDDRLSYLLARTDRGDLIEVDGVRAGGRRRPRPPGRGSRSHRRSAR